MTPSNLFGSSGPVLIDGGLSTALEEMGHDLADDLWTARLLRDSPQDIVEAHARFVRAGARVVISASYQASIGGFVAAGLEPETARRLIRESTTLARQGAATASGTLVAASVGPYGAVLADGSEYTGDYGIDAVALTEFHAERLELLVSGEPDVLAVETVPSVAEAKVLAGLITELAVPAWFSFTCGPDGRLRSGEPVADAVDGVTTLVEPVAVGVNCTDPADVGAALDDIAGRSDLPLLAYPNGGGTWLGAERRWSDAASFWIEGSFVDEWMRRGVRLIGGCCRVGPDAIHRLGERLSARGSADR